MPPTVNEALAGQPLDPTTAMILRAMAQSGSPGTAAVSRETLEEALGHLLPDSGPATLNDRLSMLASFFGNALPGRGGVGPPGRYPLGASGMDLEKRGGEIVGTLRPRGYAPIKIGRAEGPRRLEGGDQVRGQLNEMVRIAGEFNKTAPEGARLKALADRRGARSLGKASPDPEAQDALARIIQLLQGSYGRRP